MRLVTAKKIAPAAGVLAVMAGCTVGPDYVRPDIQTPAAFSGLPVGQGPSVRPTGAAPAQSLGAWWKALNDPVLDGLVGRALADNLDLKIAAARVREARALRGVAASEDRLKINANSSYERSRSSENTGFARPEGETGSDLWQAGFDASWEIDVFGRVRRSVEAADADLSAEYERERDVAVTLLAEVATNYIELRSLQQRLVIVNNSVRAQDETLGLAKARAEAGLSSELDVAQAQAQLAARRSQVPSLEAALRRSVHRLSVLVGKQPATLIADLAVVAPPPTPPAEIPAGVPSDLLRRRPDVRTAERRLAAATARIGVAEGEWFPKFSLTGNIGLESDEAGRVLDMNSRTWGIGPRMSWPILSGGRIRSNIDAANARQQQALASYKSAVLVALEEVENSLVGLTQEQTRRAALGDAIAANRTAVELSTQLNNSGLRDFLNVLDAQRALYDSEDAYAQSDRDVLLNLIALYKALGGGWAEPAEAPPKESTK